jgi:hypothetical protein
MSPLNHPCWDEYVRGNNEATIFHSAAWARVLAESYGYKPVYFTQVDNGKLTGLIPVMAVKSGLTGRRGVSLPFTDYCDPILPENVDLQDVLGQVIDYAKTCRWRTVEVRDGRGVVPAFEPSYTYYGHKLDLTPGEDKIYANFKDNTKRNIKKAFKAEIQVNLSNSYEAVKQFCQLNWLTRKKHGLPPQPNHFFENLHRHIIFHHRGIVALASCQEKVVAAAIYLHDGDMAIYKYGASHPDYLSIRPNNLVMWEAIRYYANRQYRCLCFGKTDPENLGLRRFKQGWGTEERSIFYFKLDVKNRTFLKEKSALTGIHTKIFHRTPVPILKIIGTLIYRHIG